MAKVITTTEISFNIEKLITDAKLFIVLVTPYLKIHSRLKSIIENKIKEGKVLFAIVCRQKDIQPSELSWLSNHPQIKLFYHDNLHGKCYLNETNALIASMNLYEYSMVNNIEFGVAIDSKTDTINYEIIFKECDALTANSLSTAKALLRAEHARALANFDLEKALKNTENKTPSE